MTIPFYSTNLNLSAAPQFDQSDSPEIYVDAQKVRNAMKVLQAALDLYTGALGEPQTNWPTVSPAAWNRLARLTRTYGQATEAIAVGAAVNFYNNAGALGVRNASASAAGKQCHAYASAAVASGAYGEFIQQGACLLLTGLTIGATYYLSNTAGAFSTTTGVISQKVGYALNSTTLIFRPDLV